MEMHGQQRMVRTSNKERNRDTQTIDKAPQPPQNVTTALKKAVYKHCKVPGCGATVKKMWDHVYGSVHNCTLCMLMFTTLLFKIWRRDCTQLLRRMSLGGKAKLWGGSIPQFEQYIPITTERVYLLLLNEGKKGI